ncbi:hypothetical protein [Agrobacterium genomosp. 13]|uniref:Endonuclease/exonuclease/phosphatase n=1 Tax=Agrobacterium genomosp. 13 str. CFBP 6927 TaxID=1183428 RepID=A0ABM9VJQ2_9HYPH|nr:hypothetical protein [Agrobacterium genomosp. 13]CUX47294.1 hypothetical protein AGR13a_Lc100196 [Agrobacterium genomosp. 13 str. CFBP 6927]
MEFSIFTWNLEKYNTNKSNTAAKLISDKILYSVKSDVAKERPFVGTLLEVKAKDKADATELLQSILDNLSDIPELLGQAVELGGLNHTREWIICLYSRVDVTVSWLDAGVILERRINESIIKSALRIIDKIEQRPRHLVRQIQAKKTAEMARNYDKQTERGESPVKKIKSDYNQSENQKDSEPFEDEISDNKKMLYDSIYYVNTDPKFDQNNTEGKYKAKISLFDSIKKAAMRLHGDEKYSEFVKNLIENHATFSKQDSEWYRDGILISGTFSDGSTVRIASAHLPGPNHSKVKEIVESYFDAAAARGADLIIGDLNVYGKIEHFAYEDKTGEVRRTTVGTKEQRNGRRPLDRVFLSKASSQLDVRRTVAYPPPKKPANKLAPVVTRKKTVASSNYISDHFLLRAVVRMAPPPKRQLV